MKRVWGKPKSIHALYVLYGFLLLRVRANSRRIAQSTSSTFGKDPPVVSFTPLMK